MSTRSTVIGVAAEGDGAALVVRASIGKASMLSGVFNLSNTILGAGMLGLPHAFALCGYVIGNVLLVVFGCLAVISLHLLSEAADRAGRPASFYNVAEAAVPGAACRRYAAAPRCSAASANRLPVVRRPAFLRAATPLIA